MKKILLFLLFLFIVSFQSKVYAADVFKVADPMTILQPSVTGVGRVIWLKIFALQHAGGPMILSANPDGTGDMKVGDTIEISVTLQGTFNTKRFIYNSASPCLIRKDLAPTDLSSYFPKSGWYNIQIRILDWCGGAKQISSLYLIGGKIEPSAPQPFLDLPWDYEKKGLSFNQALLSMTSYFDHSYPLLSSGINESEDVSKQITTFEGEITNQKSYSSHDGYDYGRVAGATIGETVLAAAAGEATYVNSCNACGNMILIDHKNGYQTRYMHLQREGLIIDQPGERVEVMSRQPIGKVGATGNVIPSGDRGAHLHFMVIVDKNEDGNFNDNIPDGVTDPIGWRTETADPWSNYLFQQAGVSKSGNKSFYLYKNNLAIVSSELTLHGGEYVADRMKLIFPSGAVSQTSNLKLNLTPINQTTGSLSPIGPGLKAEAKDVLDNSVTQFNVPFTLEINFNGFDTSIYRDGSISIYSSQDGINWTKEVTDVDLVAKIARSEIDHFTYFVLMGERKDIDVPNTTHQIEGERGEDNWYRSDITLSFDAKDENGVGTDYTLYSVNNKEWQIYSEPLIFEEEGNYQVDYYSVDLSDNIEPIKTLKFNVDKSVPEMKMQFDSITKDIFFSGIDDNDVKIVQNPLPHRNNEIIISDLAGNILKVNLKEKISGSMAKVILRSLQYNSEDPVTLPDNILSINSRLEEQKLENRRLEQSFNIEGILRIKAIYKIFNDTTAIETDSLDEGLNTQTMIGLKLLQISTSKGILKYTLI